MKVTILILVTLLLLVNTSAIGSTKHKHKKAGDAADVEWNPLSSLGNAFTALQSGLANTMQAIGDYVVGDGVFAVIGEKGSWTCSNPAKTDELDKRAAEHATMIYEGCQNEDSCMEVDQVRVEIIEEDELNTCFVTYRGTKNARNWMQDAQFILEDNDENMLRRKAAPVKLSEEAENEVLEFINNLSHKAANHVLDVYGDAGDEDGEHEEDSSNDNDHGDDKADNLIKRDRHKITGHIHYGFAHTHEQIAQEKKYYKALATCVAKQRTIYFTGHSLGGALATVGLMRFRSQEYYFYQDFRLSTFGSPRVGDQLFAIIFRALARDSVKRFESVSDYAENEGKALFAFDPVAKVPPTFMGYHHVGQRWQVPCDARTVNPDCHHMKNQYNPHIQNDQVCQV